MAILKIKVLTASGADVAGVTVKVSGIDSLQTNAQGMTQFLIEDADAFDISIAAQTVWSGPTSALARQEVFQQSGAGFARVAQP